MAERTFSLEAVLAFREAELETLERDLERIGRERSRERERTRDMRRKKEQGMASLEEGGVRRETGFLVAWYAWLEHMDLKIGEQEQQERLMDEEFQRVRDLWKKARMEKEKVLILRERFRGEARRRTIRQEERSLEIWVQARESNRTRSGKGEA
ncbi:MAG: hypothetical protein M1537_04450 [Nitrospirae bacterium]|nr:hypothetical protein [Nitrospirota bacterium]